MVIKRLRIPLLAAVLGVGVLAAVWIMAMRRKDPYAFLQHRSPKGTGMMHGSQLSPGFTELRMYVWEEDYARVRDRMAKELPGQGFIPRVRTGEAEWWSSLDGRIVVVEAGQSRNYREAVMQEDGGDPTGVTVTCFNQISDSWLVRLRYAFEPENGGPWNRW